MSLPKATGKRLGLIEADANLGAEFCCRAAAELAQAGQYEAAAEALGEFWRGVGERPAVAELTPGTAAEVLLQAGTVTGWLGSCRHLPGAQEAAKDMIGEALRLFESLGRSEKVAAAQYELGICYWRAGALDEARVLLEDALGKLRDEDYELKAKILIRRTLVEISAHRYRDAWQLLEAAAPVFSSCDDALKSRWHGQKAIALRRLASAEKRDDYFDRAIIEYTASVYHAESAGHERYCGSTLNNLAFLLCKLGRYAEAHENLDRARAVLARLKDAGAVAQVDETRARVLLAEGRHTEAETFIHSATQALARGEERALLAEALTVQAIVSARLGKHDRSLAQFQLAISTGEEAGAPESAGQAILSLIEEHGAARLSAHELYSYYQRADELLARTQDNEDIARLRACARIVMRKLLGIELGAGFSLPKAVQTYEACFIEQALKEEQGSVSRAARRLGMKHQSLAHLLRSRHRDLLSVRTPAIPRRRSIIQLRAPRHVSLCAVRAKAVPVSILHVEDNYLIADVVKDTLESEGWQVESCADGNTGVTLLESDAPFDLLILDNELPGVSGLELAQLARQLPHRQRTPIIMLSATPNEAAARRIGVDKVLRKPDQIQSVIEVAQNLLDK